MLDVFISQSDTVHHPTCILPTYGGVSCYLRTCALHAISVYNNSYMDTSFEHRRATVNSTIGG